VPHDHDVQFTAEFWDDRYRSAGQLWSGQPNPQLVAQAAGLAPGDALDAGCGEGADAIWLAARGWAVTGADVSAVALGRAAAHAAAAGAPVAGRITWEQRDLLSWVPEPQRFDLVTAQFMHLPGPAFEAMYGRLAAAVRPGGTLLVVAHDPGDVHVNVGREHGPGLFFPAAEQMAAALDPGGWEVVFAGGVGRTVTGLDGEPVTVTDTVLRAGRRA
jgi:SAM-dependent methyltransferase